ncbi:ferric-chelate reductase Frp1 [Fusarium equiseti]|uniref:Ferric-chelate reductase Frp1 n=1 Tax=Fusarium equiseti TaxID=61235 RepID=A0ABQ8RPM1_FUSEQ|nr:ferric-chelate reductase Frp1 [Fusarium equiseti]
MCYTSVLHFTHCDTRRPAVLNPETGLTLFHPLEPPQPCKHAHPLVPGCPYHGSCCTPRQKFHCSKIRNPQMACMGGQVYHQVVDPRSLDSYDKLLPITADDWEDMVKPTQGLEYEEDIRREFFNAGARMHELATTALKTIKYFYQNASFPNVAQMEERDFLFHGEVYWKWMVAREELFQLTEAWESRASAGTMEVCPASLLEEHPILSNFPRAPWTHPGFPQFASLPFTTTQTFKGLENVLRWHPFYTTMHNKPSAPSTVAQRSRSPARPQDSNTDIIRRVENANRPWPGEWEGIIPTECKDLPLRDWVPVSATSSMIPVPGSDLDALSPGPQIPPWVIPYGEEPDMGFKKVIPWDQPATFIESPPVSPRSIPYPRVIPATPDVTEAVAILEINSMPYDDEGRSEPAYPDDGGWSEYVAVEGQATRDFLCVSIPETPSDRDSELKRNDDDERNEGWSDYIGAEERAVWEFLRECDQQSPKLKRRRSDDSDKENGPREAKRHCAA